MAERAGGCKMKKIGFVSLALVATLTAGCSKESGKDSGPPKRDQPATAATRAAADATSRDAGDFIHHVAIVNKAEIDLGKLAADRGGADEVKRFAQMMIHDHTASGDKLRVLAAELKVQAPDQLDQTRIDERDKLAREAAPDFDRDYATAMVDGHKDLLDQLEPRIDKTTLDRWKAAMNGKTTVESGTAPVLADQSENPTTMRVNQFAAEIYPTVHAHLEAAKALESSLKKRRTTP
jgi:putative membrane protein